MLRTENLAMGHASNEFLSGDLCFTKQFGSPRNVRHAQLSLSGNPLLIPAIGDTNLVCGDHCRHASRGDSMLRTENLAVGNASNEFLSGDLCFTNQFVAHCAPCSVFSQWQPADDSR